MLTHEVYNGIDVTIQSSDCARHGGRQKKYFSHERDCQLVMNVTANFCTTRRTFVRAVGFPRNHLVQVQYDEGQGWDENSR